MNVTAELRRVCKVVGIAALVLTFTSCAQTSRSAGTVDLENVDTVALNAEETQGLESPAAMPELGESDSEIVSPSTVEATLIDDSTGIEIEHAQLQDRSGELLILSLGSADINYEISEIDNPTRLVLDIDQPILSSNKTISLPQSQIIERLRLGSHPDKSRIVLDINTGQQITHQAEIDSTGSLVIALAKSPELAQMASQQIQEPIAESLRPKLASLSIQSSGRENEIIAAMESAGFYTLARTAPSEYVLTLENAELADLNIQTILAPPQSGSIRSVRPVIQGENLLLRIFAEPGTRLVARSRGSNIIVTPQAGELGSFDSLAGARAQADLEEAAEDAAPPDEIVVEPDMVLEDTGASDADVVNLDDSLTDEDLGELLGEGPKYTGRLISLDLQDTDIDNALRIIAEVSNLNIIASDEVTGRVTLRLIDVPWDQALDVILKTNGLDKVQEGNVVRIAPVDKLRQERESLRQAQLAQRELEPLVVKYMRISYAKAADLKPLVETVMTERGTVTYDERTNQLILRDILDGIKNAVVLVSKLDLRTPQILLETQIVEANRSLIRELGSELGFRYVRSPEFGNATDYNFPNSIDVGGTVGDGGAASSFPVGVDSATGSAVSFLFDSADGAKSLDVRLSALENEGRVRVVSRPAVATTNNKAASIKSVEKIRIKTPDGGLSVATGSGASASGSSAVATESIEVGITLDVTPQASPDYFVLLDINAKSSSFGSREVDGIPSEIERSATSTVLISSGQTFAMGGIYRIIDSDAIAGIPFFKDIPVLGHFFRSSGTDNSDEELLFFITPRIIEGSFDDAAMRVAS